MQMGAVGGFSIWRKLWQQGKLYNIHCQGFQLWVGVTPKSKWWTSKPEILKGSPSSYVNCKLTYLQQREALTLSTFPTATVQPVFMLRVECCQLSSRAMASLPIGQRCHAAPHCQLIKMLKGECCLQSRIILCAAFMNFMEEETYLDVGKIS